MLHNFQIFHLLEEIVPVSYEGFVTYWKWRWVIYMFIHLFDAISNYNLLLLLLFILFSPPGNLQDSITFILTNFIEMNKLPTKAIAK